MHCSRCHLPNLATMPHVDSALVFKAVTMRLDALGGRKALAVRAEGERDGRPRRRVELAVVRRAALEGRGLRPALEGRLQRLRGRRDGAPRSSGPQGRLVPPAGKLTVAEDGHDAIQPAAQAFRLIEQGESPIPGNLRSSA